ncbi:hypothetical protein SO802_014860 [Lithocarpus litseifolius]|uniref:Aminotransferase-like plant mobile domain-containing protein n=1 Tax=Lithocarpus litseifolius TaxID=425828 RepID=A0AAW2CSS5_9ROSI
MEPQMDEEPAIVRPGPENASLLTHQQNHRSEAIWNGEDLGPLTCRGRSKEMANITMEDNRVIDIIKWVRVPSSKSRPSGMALIYYREQLVRVQSSQIMWQPYEADLGRLPAFCVAGRDTWTARVPLVCFCIVETHHPDRVLRQFGLAQERPDHVVYDHRLHRINLRGKVEKNWREEHGPYILTWDMRQQRLCHAPPQIGEMPHDHAYYRWYRLVTRKYVDRNNAKLDIMIESHLSLLAMLPIGIREHNHVQRVLSHVVGLGGVPAPNGEQANNGEANNGQENEPTAITTPSTSAALLIPPTRGRRAIASPSTSAARGRGRPNTASSSTSAARGRGRTATASPSTSATTGRGRRATTRGVVTSPEIPAPIHHASPQPEVHSPIPDASPQFEVPPPMVDASPQPEVPSPTHLRSPVLILVFLFI